MLSGEGDNHYLLTTYSVSSADLKSRLLCKYFISDVSVIRI